jgi:uncharacterized protein (DUF2267 family)
MSKQTQEQKTFLDKVVERSSLQTENDAQHAANIVFRILRDMMSNATDKRIEEDLKQRASEAERIGKLLGCFLLRFGSFGNKPDLSLTRSLDGSIK